MSDHWVISDISGFKFPASEMVYGVAVISAAQIVTITSTGDDTGVTFTVTGTDADGRDQSEDVTGANAGAAATTGFYKTVTSISSDGATDGDIIIGVLDADGARGQMIPVNFRATDFSIGIGVVVTGTINYTVQHTFQDPQDVSITPTFFANIGLTSKTANDNGNYAFPVSAVRIIANSCAGGTASMTLIQAG